MVREEVRSFGVWSFFACATAESVAKLAHCLPDTLKGFELTTAMIHSWPDEMPDIEAAFYAERRVVVGAAIIAPRGFHHVILLERRHSLHAPSSNKRLASGHSSSVHVSGADHFKAETGAPKAGFTRTQLLAQNGLRDRSGHRFPAFKLIV